MNKKLSMLLPVIATCGLLAGCGTDYYTKDSTVFVAKNGSVVTSLHSSLSCLRSA